jgi:hypothetical protein
MIANNFGWRRCCKAESNTMSDAVGNEHGSEKEEDFQALALLAEEHPGEDCPLPLRQCTGRRSTKRKASYLFCS